MAKPNYSFEKRQRDLEKKKKQEEKRQKKLDKKNTGSTPGNPESETPGATAENGNEPSTAG